MLKQTLSVHQAAEILMCDSYAHWSSEAARTLADYFEDLSEDIGEDIEFDPVAIRCEFSEYTEAELIGNFHHLISSNVEDEDELIGEIVESLRDRSTCIELDNGNFLVREF